MNDICLFFFSVGSGFWSTVGVETVYDEESNTLTCLSQHLTSFAVLVDTSGLTTVSTYSVYNYNKAHHLSLNHILGDYQ